MFLDFWSDVWRSRYHNHKICLWVLSKCTLHIEFTILKYYWSIMICSWTIPHSFIIKLNFFCRSKMKDSPSFSLTSPPAVFLLLLITLVLTPPPAVASEKRLCDLDSERKCFRQCRDDERCHKKTRSKEKECKIDCRKECWSFDKLFDFEDDGGYKVEPTLEPTLEPTFEPTTKLTLKPTKEPMNDPMNKKTSLPTNESTLKPTSGISTETPEPTGSFGFFPIGGPAPEPSDKLTDVTPLPTDKPTSKPTAGLSAETSKPSARLGEISEPDPKIRSLQPTAAPVPTPKPTPTLSSKPSVMSIGMRRYRQERTRDLLKHSSSAGGGRKSYLKRVKMLRGDRDDSDDIVS